jgi:hypothetical protein
MAIEINEDSMSATVDGVVIATATLTGGHWMASNYFKEGPLLEASMSGVFLHR